MRHGKKALFGLAVLAAILGCASAPQPLSSEKNIYQEVIEIQKPQNELFISSMKWMTDAFTSAKAVIEYQDKEEGIIIGKGTAQVGIHDGSGKSSVEFTIRLEVKDNRARVTFKDMSIAKATTSGSYSTSAAGALGAALAIAIINTTNVYGWEQHGRFTRWAQTVISAYGTYIAGESDDW